MSSVSIELPLCTNADGIEGTPSEASDIVTHGCGVRSGFSAGCSAPHAAALDTISAAVHARATLPLNRQAVPPVRSLARIIATA
jgi:hypothetical protein